ncbi:MAG TPA: hypothetical protein VNJ46_01990 [Gaiellaceae bacterium]|nr:hypothetical protein [Gaiellaceae bacterium]
MPHYPLERERFRRRGRKSFVGYRTGVRGPREVVEPYPHHGNHMHVRLPPPR